MGGQEKLSFALVTRLQKSETPFLNEFLEYYKHIGINRFYLINTEPHNRQFIEETISAEFKELICLIDNQDADSIKGSQNLALPKVKETFLLSLDMDEFLYLDGMNLSEFVESEKLENHRDDFLECSFHWVMSPLCDRLYAPSIKHILDKRYFFPSQQLKTMYYTKDIDVIGEHESTLKGSKNVKKTYSATKNNCFIFHVSARGTMDIINKIQFGQFKDLKEALLPQDELNEFIYDETSSFLPGRFTLLAFQSRFAPYVIECDFNYPHLNHQTDVELLKEITLGGLRNLLDRDVSEADLGKLIYDKMNACEFPTVLVKAYAKEKIVLMEVLRFYTTRKQVYYYPHFLRYEGEVFITHLYHTILKREPSRAELEHYLFFLRTGAKNKMETIDMIRCSQEGRKANIIFTHSKKRYLLARLYAVPFIRKLAKSFILLFKLYR